MITSTTQLEQILRYAVAYRGTAGLHSALDVAALTVPLLPSWARAVSVHLIKHAREHLESPTADTSNTLWRLILSGSNNISERARSRNMATTERVRTLHTAVEETAYMIRAARPVVRGTDYSPGHPGWEVHVEGPSAYLHFVTPVVRNIARATRDIPGQQENLLAAASQLPVQLTWPSDDDVRSAPPEAQVAWDAMDPKPETVTFSHFVGIDNRLSATGLNPENLVERAVLERIRSPEQEAMIRQILAVPHTTW